MISSWRKHASSQIPTNAKTTGLYVNSMLAGEEARRNGYAEAIVLNKEGNVAEGPGENVFLVRDGEIYTPGLSESILDGITRETVITLAEDLGYTVHDNVSISRGELNTADELFFTGSAAEVTPIRKVDNVVIGDGSRGPVTEDIQSRFSTSSSARQTSTTSGSRTSNRLERVLTSHRNRFRLFSCGLGRLTAERSYEAYAISSPVLSPTLRGRSEGLGPVLAPTPGRRRDPSRATRRRRPPVPSRTRRRDSPNASRDARADTR